MSSFLFSIVIGAVWAAIKVGKSGLRSAARWVQSRDLSGKKVQAAARMAVACVAVAALWMIWPTGFGSLPAQGQKLPALAPATVDMAASSLPRAVVQDTSRVDDVSARQAVAMAVQPAAPTIASLKAAGRIQFPELELDSERGGGALPALALSGLLATPTFTPSPAPRSAPNLDFVEAINAESFRASPTPTPTPTAMPIQRPTRAPVPVLAVKGRIWPDFAPASAEVADHYWLARPFAPGTGNPFPALAYPYGTTGDGNYLLHHGVDMGGFTGTRLLALAAGEVFHAGPDSETVIGPYVNFYGQTVVIRLDQRLVTWEGERDVFVLYGHLSQVAVTAGQRVERGDLVGYVGMSGIALGPHLHIEVRVGGNDYVSTVNPWLWLTPAPGLGTLAVRLLAADGSTWQGARLTLFQLTRDGSRAVRTLTTYLDAESIGPDPVWGENGVMGDLPAGAYLLAGNVNDERVEAPFTINGGQTTFVELRTGQ